MDGTKKVMHGKTNGEALAGRYLRFKAESTRGVNLWKVTFFFVGVADLNS